MGQELDHIARDSKVSSNTAKFIRDMFYVDDGLTSSTIKKKLLDIKKELHGSFAH